jgi:hypothetical protein
MKRMSLTSSHRNRGRSAPRARRGFAMMMALGALVIIWVRTSSCSRGPSLLPSTG